jgi:transcriptional regulator with XRE-family HTH domain
MPTAKRDLVSSLGLTLRALRTKRSLEANAVAKRAGIPASVLADIEAGRPTGATIERLERVAAALGTNIVAVMSLAKKPPPKVNASADVARLAAAIVELPPELGDKLGEIESAVVRRAMQLSGGNKSAAARLLGMERKSLVRKWMNITRK